MILVQENKQEAFADFPDKTRESIESGNHNLQEIATNWNHPVVCPKKLSYFMNFFHREESKNANHTKFLHAFFVSKSANLLLKTTMPLFAPLKMRFSILPVHRKCRVESEHAQPHQTLTPIFVHIVLKKIANYRRKPLKKWLSCSSDQNPNALSALHAIFNSLNAPTKLGLKTRNTIHQKSWLGRCHARN